MTSFFAFSDRFDISGRQELVKFGRKLVDGLLFIWERKVGEGKKDGNRRLKENGIR